VRLIPSKHPTKYGSRFENMAQNLASKGEGTLKRARARTHTHTHTHVVAFADWKTLLPKIAITTEHFSFERVLCRFVFHVW
jgi:hypothetical protein